MFNDLDKEIEKLISERKLTKTSTSGVTASGTIMSVPGTEKIVIATNVADFMTCAAIGTGPKAKERYCIVHKNQPIKYNGQFVDSNGNPVSIVTKGVFDVITSIVHSMKRQVEDLKRDLERAELDKEAYKMMIDGLRKNGVID